MKTLYIILIFLFISNAGYSQDKIKKDPTQITDTAKYKILKKVNINKPTIYLTNNNGKHQAKMTPKTLYRPTRLGSSSPLYDTYKKNDYGAGAITTNPQKSGKSFIYNAPVNSIDSVKKAPADSIPLK